MFIHGSAAGGTSVAADNARRCRTTDPSQDKGLRKRIGIRIQAKHCPVEGGQPMRYSNWLAGSEQWLHQRLDRGNERGRKLIVL
jgi:hypothetical protein